VFSNNVCKRLSCYFQLFRFEVIGELVLEVGVAIIEFEISKVSNYSDLK